MKSEKSRPLRGRLAMAVSLTEAETVELAVSTTGDWAVTTSSSENVAGRMWKSTWTSEPRETTMPRLISV
jgi:hypothetical protein